MQIRTPSLIFLGYPNPSFLDGYLILGGNLPSYQNILITLDSHCALEVFLALKDGLS